MIDALRPFIARLVAIAVMWAVGHLTTKYGITVDNESQAKLVDSIVNIMTSLMFVYVGVHRYASKLTNPGDAASSHLAESESEETARLKAMS